MTAFGEVAKTNIGKDRGAKVTLGKLDRNKVKDYLNKFLILKESFREEDRSLDKIVGHARFTAKVVQHALDSEGALLLMLCRNLRHKQQQRKQNKRWISGNTTHFMVQCIVGD